MMMRSGRLTNSPGLRWGTLLALIVMIAVWSARTVAVRAKQMRTQNVTPLAFSTFTPGAIVKVVVRLDSREVSRLRGTILQRETDTVYRTPIGPVGPPIVALLTPETGVIMGQPKDIVSGGIVQLAGTLNQRHELVTSQVVVLTGYVHLDSGGDPQ